jgi:flagellar motor switch protein FliG
VTPDAVDPIGRSLITQLDDEPILAFTNKPEERLGAILNSSRSVTRDELLDGLDEADQTFAAEVRKAIFTFKHVAERVDERDVPAILKSVDNDTLVTALASATDEATKISAEFIFANISSRMAEQLRRPSKNVAKWAKRMAKSLWQKLSPVFETLPKQVKYF